MKKQPRKRAQSELLDIADDLSLAITNAAWEYMVAHHGPTPHMDMAVAALEEWKKRNKV